MKMKQLIFLKFYLIFDININPSHEAVYYITVANQL